MKNVEFLYGKQRIEIRKLQEALNTILDTISDISRLALLLLFLGVGTISVQFKKKTLCQPGYLFQQRFLCVCLVVIHVSCLQSSPQEQAKQKYRKQCVLFKSSPLVVFHIKFQG